MRKFRTIRVVTAECEVWAESEAEALALTERGEVLAISCAIDVKVRTNDDYQQADGIE
jgi:hypothetical protein